MNKKRIFKTSLITLSVCILFGCITKESLPDPKYYCNCASADSVNMFVYENIFDALTDTMKVSRPYKDHKDMDTSYIRPLEIRLKNQGVSEICEKTHDWDNPDYREWNGHYFETNCNED